MTLEELGINEHFDIDTIQDKIRSPEILIEFIRMLEEDIVAKRPELSRRALPDVLDGVAGWIEDTNPPDQPDWGYVARLLVAAVHYD